MSKGKYGLRGDTAVALPDVVGGASGAIVLPVIKEVMQYKKQAAMTSSGVQVVVKPRLRKRRNPIEPSGDTLTAGSDQESLEPTDTLRLFSPVQPGDPKIAAVELEQSRKRWAKLSMLFDEIMRGTKVVGDLERLSRELRCLEESQVRMKRMAGPSREREDVELILGALADEPAARAKVLAALGESEDLEKSNG